MRPLQRTDPEPCSQHASAFVAVAGWLPLSFYRFTPARHLTWIKFGRIFGLINAMAVLATRQCYPNHPLMNLNALTHPNGV